MTARRRCVCCVLYLHAVVMRALSIEVAAMIVDAAVIQGAEAHEAVLQRVVPLLVHVVVPDYILFTSKPLQKQEGEGEGGYYTVRFSNKSLHLCGGTSCKVLGPTGRWRKLRPQRRGRL